MGDEWVMLAVAAIGGGGAIRGVELLFDRLGRRAERRRSEVDRMAKLLAEAQAQARVAGRRERIATEWGHKNAVIAIRAGIPESELPVLDFKDDD